MENRRDCVHLRCDVTVMHSLPRLQRISFANFQDPVPRLRTLFVHDFEVTTTMVRFGVLDGGIVPVDRELYRSDWHGCTDFSDMVWTWGIPHTIQMATQYTRGYRDRLRRW